MAARLPKQPRHTARRRTATHAFTLASVMPLKVSTPEPTYASEEAAASACIIRTSKNKWLPTDRQTDQPTDRRTDPLIEMRGRI